MAATTSPDVTTATAGIEHLLDLAAVKAISGLGRSSVLKAAKLGHLKCIRFGHSVRFRPADVRTWINSAAA